MSLNLELSKLLLEKGVRLETEFSWYLLREGNWERGLSKQRSSVFNDTIPAPSTDDLLEVLPNGYHLWKSFCMENDLGYWCCGRFSEPEFEYSEPILQGNTPGEALAKIILYLIDHEGYHYNQQKGVLEK